MGIEWRSVGRPRGMPFLLALLALALQVVVPPGDMVGGGSEGPARIVICTAHGPVATAADLGGPTAPARGKSSPMPCAFVGHAAPASLASTAPELTVQWPGFVSPEAPAASHLIVGRGLAAPPPARAPPAILA